MPTGPDGQPIDRATISPWAVDRLDIPMIPVDGKNHSTLIADPDDGMVNLLVDFLKVGEPGADSYDVWLKRAQQFGSGGLPKMLINPGSGSAGLGGEIKKFFEHVIGDKPDELMEGWQQFVVHAVDERGDGISDYMIEVLTQQADGTWGQFNEMYTDVHAYGPDSSFRCFHIRLPKGSSAGAIPLRVRINASTGTELMAYQGYGSNVTRKLGATADPVELDISDLGSGNGTLFHPFTTTLIEIVLNREPLPFDDESRILRFLKQ